MTFMEYLTAWTTPPPPIKLKVKRRPIQLRAKHRADVNDVLARTRAECDRMIIVDEVREFMSASLGRTSRADPIKVTVAHNSPTVATDCPGHGCLNCSSDGLDTGHVVA